MDMKNIQFLIEMLGKLDDTQAKAGTDIKAWREKMAAWKEKMAAETRAIQARTKAMRENMGTSHKEMVAEATLERNIETIACQEIEAHLDEEKPTSVDMKPEAVQQREVPNEDAIVKPVEEPKKKRRRDRRLAAERRRQKQQDSTRENGAPQKELAVACRKMPHRATVARRMRDIFRLNMTRRAIVARPRKDICWPNMTRCAKVTQRKRCRFQSSQEVPPVEQGWRKNRTRNHSTRGTWKMILYEIVGRKIAKQIAGASAGLRQDKDWTLWRGRPPPKRKKKRLQAEEE
jgi:hypothetical protein